MTELLEGKRLIFLIGAPRSGTTWLQLMLASASEVASANETHLFTNYMQSLFRGWDRLRDSAREVGLHHLVTEDQYLSSVRDFAARALAAIAARKPDARVILEKTPGHAFAWRDIARIFPDAHFLHLVRDPRAVIASLLAAKKEWESGDWVPARVTSACEFWRQHVTAATPAKATGRYHEVRYEDLREPATLRRVFAFLGVDRSETECDSIISSYTIDKLRKSEAIAPWSLAEEPKAFFRRGETESWRTELSPAAIATIEASLGKLMETYRYSIEQRQTVRHTVSVRIAQSGDRARSFLSRRLQGLAERLR
jgi:hypothetical protein